MFEWRTKRKAEPAPAPSAAPRPGAKGRPTPKRSEAESQRRQRVAPPRNSKEAYRRQREEARAVRLREREALLNGDERHLPFRDRGPARRFARDYVDSRHTLAEFFLPFGLVVLLVSFTPNPSVKGAALLVWLVLLVSVTIEIVLRSMVLRRVLHQRFPKEDLRGVVSYAVIRSTQLRRFRLPRPQVKTGRENRVG